MGVLYFANDLTLPSVEWMRRMLRVLEPDVASLVTEVEPGSDYRQRFDVTVLSDSWWSHGWRLSRRLGLTQGIRKTARALDALRREVESNRVEVTLVHYLSEAVKYDRVWHRTAKPVFVHCHGFDVTWDFRDADDPTRPAHPADYVDRVLKLPEHVSFIVNSNVTARRLREIDVAEERIHVKYLGVPIPDAPPVRDADGEIVIFYLGRLVDCKGPELVIEAFDLACQRGLDGRLVIAGNGPMQGECERARERSAVKDRIELLGAVDTETANRLRRSADIFTAHNRLGPVSRQEEAFGVAVAEAMADGLPIVSGANGSLPELVDDGVEGILVSPGDVEAHAEALLRLAGDAELRARMGRRGWQRASRDFSLEQEDKALRSILGLARP